MAADLQSLIPTVVANPELHAKWLNTFSYLEYIGFRKIVKSQDAGDLTAETLAHAVEEGRHALKLKKLAVKIGGREFNRYQNDVILCKTAADRYFQLLDQICRASVEGEDQSKQKLLNYLYVTWIVERRALDIYQRYQSALPRSEATCVQGLLKEEHLHLHRVEKNLERLDERFDPRAAELLDAEKNLYDIFVGTLSMEVQQMESERGIRQ